MAQSATKPRRRANGEGSIYYVESESRWRAALSWTDSDGRARRRVVTGKTQSDVRRRLTELRADLDRGREPASVLTVAQYLGRAEERAADGSRVNPASGWLERERARIKPSTWTQREQYVRCYLVPALGRTPLAKLTPADVERMTTRMISGGLSARTASHARVILRRALADAERDGLVHRNVAALARPPRVPGRRMEAGRDYLDTAQLRRLLDRVASHPLGPIVTVAATTGMRQGELLGLAWSDISADGRSLIVRRSLARSWDGWALAEPKTARSRRPINLPTVAVDALDRQRRRQDAEREAAGDAWQDRDGLVFTDSIGRPLVNSNVTRIFHELLNAAGLPSVPFHALRHSAATALLAAGVPLRTVSDLLGHSTITITADIYAAVVPELRRDAADAMDRALGR